MELGVLRLGLQHHDVVRMVVSLVSIDVMDNLSRKKLPSQDLLCNNAVFMSTILLRIGDTFPSSKLGLAKFLSYLRSHPRRIQTKVDFTQTLSIPGEIRVSGIALRIRDFVLESIHTGSGTKMVFFASHFTFKLFILLTAPVTRHFQSHPTPP